jgi:hypothetical protein
VLPGEHETEHEEVQVMWHDEFPVQFTLPLAPSVAVRSELDSALRLHDCAHDPTHDVWFVQSRVQLPASPPQPLLEKSHEPLLQLQVAPVHEGGGALEDPPQAASVRQIKAKIVFMAQHIPRAGRSSTT